MVSGIVFIGIKGMIFEVCISPVDSFILPYIQMSKMRLHLSSNLSFCLTRRGAARAALAERIRTTRGAFLNAYKYDSPGYLDSSHSLTTIESIDS